MVFAYYDKHLNRIVLNSQYQEKELIKAIPGSLWNSDHRKWTLPLAWASCVALRGSFNGNLHLDDSLVDWANKHRQTIIDPAKKLRESTEKPVEANYRYEDHLYPFQAAGTEYLALCKDVLLGDEMGCGKTVQVISALSHRLSTQDTLPALVICPNSIKQHWKTQLLRWYPDSKNHIYILSGGITRKRKTLEQASNDRQAIVIINIESVRLMSRMAPYGSIRLRSCIKCNKDYGDSELSSAKCETHSKELNNFGFQTIILDEAHRVKDPKSKQTRAIWYLMHELSVKYRWGMTGTPLVKNPADFWSIMHGIAPYDYPVKSKFVKRYCLTTDNSFGGVDIVGTHPSTKDELFSFTDPHFRRMLKIVVLPQLPEKIREVRTVELSPRQLKMYKDIAKDSFTYDENGELYIVPHQLTKALRLSQLASASFDIEKIDNDRPDAWKITLRNPSPKLDEFEAILEDIGDVPCVAAAESKQLINLAADRLKKRGIPHALITGDIYEYDRNKALELLNKKKIKVLLFTVQAGGTGLDMSAADTIINLQRSWSLAHILQTENRVHRVGSEKHNSIRIIDIVTLNTIEQTQIERIQRKFNRLDEITRDSETLRKAGMDSSKLENEKQNLLTEFIGLPDNK